MEWRGQTDGTGDRRLADYVSLVTDCVARQDGSAFAAALAINATNSYAETVSLALDHTKDPAKVVKQVDKHAPLGEMLLHHTRAMQCYHQNRYVDAYNALERSANAFLQEYRNWESTWAMEALHVIVYALRTVAEMADREMATNGKAPDKLKGAGSFLMKVFGAIQGKGPKRVGALYVTCQLFKIYFKLGTVHMCRSVIRSIDTSRFFDFEDFPAKDRVTYMYYTGRLEVFNDNVSAADRKLTYALERCDPFKKANIRMILKYLIPVRLALGLLPKERLLARYNLAEYVDIVRALKRGDVRLLRRALQANETKFFRSGVYLVLEKLESHVYRRLLRKIYNIQKQRDPSRAHQVRMDVILKAMKWLEVDMDMDEVECCMAILIHKSLMKGYFSHKSRVVVLSKQDAFPKLTGRQQQQQ